MSTEAPRTMQTRRARAWIAPLVALAGALVVPACASTPSTTGASPPAPTASPAVAAAAPAEATFTMREYQIDGPEQLPAGVTTVTARNEGAETHHVVFARLEDGVTEQDFAAAFAKLDPTGVATLLGGPDGVSPGTSVPTTIALTPGTYLLACFIPGPDGVPHFMKGMTTELVVTPSEASTELPDADRTVHLGEYRIGRGGSELEGFRATGTMTVVNEGSELHHLDIVRLDDGASIDDVVAAASIPIGTPRPEPPYQGVGGISFLSPGVSGQIDFDALDLTPGRYAFVCMIPSPSDRRSHVAKGMYAEFQVDGG